jgi:peptidoglycan/xylan/chitin deacetylase (PgdA/CDA1 family)
VLRRLGLPAIVFLPVNFIGQRRLFWREELTHLIVDVIRSARTDSALRSRVAPVLAAAGLAGVLDAEGADPRPAVIAAIAAQPGLRVTAAKELMQALESMIGRSVDPAGTPDTFVTWDDVLEMAQAGVAFGGHGAEHVLLAEIPREQAGSEIHGAYHGVRSRCAAEATAFSYPNGSFNAEVADIVKSAGFRLAFTTRPGRISSRDNPLTLARVNIHEDATQSAPMFLARVLGVM